MKRNFKLLAAVVVLVALVMTLASCDVINGLIDKINPQQPHEHTYSDAWSSDETNHWHAATCTDTEECGSQKSDVAAHTFADGKCTVCNAEDPDYTPACTEHAYSIEETKAPTCTEAGEKTLTCTVCGATEKQSVAATDHTKVTVDGKAPTCTEAGLSNGEKCSVCDTVLKEQTEIPATSHTYVEGECSCGAEDPNYNGPKTYVLDAATLATKEKEDVDGFHGNLLAGTKDFFNIYLAKKTKIGANAKTFEDGFVSVNRLDWQTGSVIDNDPETDEVTLSVIEINVEGTATVKIWWSCGGDGRTVAIYDEDGEVVAQASTETTKNSLYISELKISKPGKYYIGNVGGNNPYFKVEVVVTPYEAPAIPENMKVTTHNSYGFNDMAEPPVVDSFTAPVAGYYTFGLPAGLGLWSKASLEANPYGNPDVAFYDNALGENYTVELDEGEVFEFYVGAMTAEDWLITISYSEEAPPEPTVITLQDGENKFTVQEIDITDGVTAYLYVYESATYTFEGTGLFINVYSYGMLVTRGYESVTVDLEGGMWGAEYTLVIGAETVGDYALTVSAVTPTNLYDGENTVTVDADGADCVYYAMNDGDYFFNVTGATVAVLDPYTGEALTANADGSYTLDAYVQYKIVVTSETAGDYTVEVVAPVFLSQDEDNTVTVGTDSVVVFFETGEKGHYTVSGEGLTIVVTDAEGNTVEAGALLPGNALYTVTITAAEAGDYAVKLSFASPIGAYDNPHKVESLPATLTPSLIAEYDNYYYEFTASATGHATLTYTVASGTLYGATLGGVESETTTITIPVVKGMTYQVYFSAASAAEVSATLTLEAGELTEAEWKDIIVYTTIEFANGTNVSITQDWMTEEHQIFCYQVDADWIYLFKAYYSYTVTANEDGSLTLKLTYLEGNENNAGTAPAIGDIKVELVDGEWVASCVHTYADHICSICGALYVGGEFQDNVPADLVYITNNSSYPDPGYYSNGGLKMNYVNQGIQTVSFTAQTSVTATLYINAFNENTKSDNADVDAFTFYALDAEGNTVASVTLNTLELGANSVTLEGEGIVCVKVIMTDYYYNGTKCCNLNVGGLSVTN